MSGHHSVDTSIWIRQANKTARWRLREAEQGWGILRSGWSCKECKEGFWPIRKCLILPHSFRVLFLSLQELLYPSLPAQFYIYISVDIGEGNGNPLPRSCLENPRDGEAWWAAISGVAQSRTRLKRLSSSSSSSSRHVLCMWGCPGNRTA